jgi:hypothetical protein
MSPQDAKKNAALFLKDQAAIIKKYGEAPKLSGQRFQAAFNGTVRTFRSLGAANKRAP